MYDSLSLSSTLWENGFEAPPPHVDATALNQQHAPAAPLAPDTVAAFDALPPALGLLQAVRGYAGAWQFLVSTSLGLRAAQLRHCSALLYLAAAWRDRAAPRLRQLALMDVHTARLSLWGAVAGVRANRAKLFGAIIGVRSALYNLPAKEGGGKESAAAQLVLAQHYEELTLGGLGGVLHPQHPAWTVEKLVAPGSLSYSANPLLSPLPVREAWA